MGLTLAAKKSATLPPPVFAACGAGESLDFLLVIWEKICYCVLQEKEGASRLPLFSHLENCIGSNPHQSTQLPGYRRKVSRKICSFCSLPGSLPTKPNDQPTNGTNELICSVDRSVYRCRLFWRCCRPDGNGRAAPTAQRNPVVRSRGALRWL